MTQQGESSSAAVLESNLGGGSKGGEPEAASVVCSICLEAVDASLGRSIVRLQCAHEFHLDCIGSAFNFKRKMQCPNCRQVENGSWLCADGLVSIAELIAEITQETVLSGTDNSEMLHQGSHSRLPQVQSSFEEGESSGTINNRDLPGSAPITWSPVSPVHPSLYMPSFQQPQSSVSYRSLLDAPLYGPNWNGFSGRANAWTSYSSPSSSLHYPEWQHHSHSHYAPPSNLASAVDQTFASNGLQWASPRFNATILGHGSASGPPPMGVAPAMGVPTPVSAPLPRSAPQLFLPQHGDPRLRPDLLEDYRQQNPSSYGIVSYREQVSASLGWGPQSAEAGGRNLNGVFQDSSWRAQFHRATGAERRAPDRSDGSSSSNQPTNTRQFF